MTPEERQMLGGLFERINAAGATPRDPEAEVLHQRRGSRRPVLRPTSWPRPRSSSSTRSRPRRIASPSSRRRPARAPSRASNRAVFSAILARRSSAAARQRRRSDRAMTSRPIRGRLPRRATRPNRRKVIPRSRRAMLRRHRAIRLSRLARGASLSLRAAAAFCRTRLRPRRAWRAASSLAICWAACSAAMAAVSLAAGQAPPGSAARAFPAATRPRSQRSTTTTTTRKAAARATPTSSGSTPARRASRTPISTNLDDSSFDNSDGSSFDDGGGYDDV